MKATLEPVPDTPDLEPKVKLVVQVDETELEPAIAAAWKEIAREARIPGFRPGKAPRALMEKQFGPGYARSEALNHAVPEFYAEAIITHDVDVISQPELDITEGRDEGDVTFTAVVGIRPTVTVAGYGGLRVEVPSPEVPEADVDEQVDRLRAQYGELESVDRPAGDGDYVSVDIHGSQDGEEVDGLTVDDYLYAVGSGMIAPEFDEHLTGAKAGDILEFTAEHPDPDEDEVEFRILVKDVKHRVLPELTDEWAEEASEFDTVQELRDDIRARLTEDRENQTRSAVSSRVGAELAKLVDEEIPESLVAGEMQMRLQNMILRLRQQGLDLEDFLKVTGQEPDAFMASLKEAADEGVKVDLALRAVVTAEGLEPSEEDVEEIVGRMIGDDDLTMEEAKERLRSSGQLSAIRSDLAAEKAVTWLVEHAEVVDPDGKPIDDRLLQPVDDEQDHGDHDHGDHDHDHDHD